MMRASVGTPALHFRALGAQASHAYATPTIELMTEIACDEAYEIRTVTLNVDVRIAAARRRYDDAEQERLRELFGDVSQWAHSLRSLQWMHGSLNVPRFSASTTVRIPLPCSYDFEVASAKYLSALESGEIPVDVLFSGTVFYCAEDGGLQTAMIPWESEVSLRIPIDTWREAVDAAFPETCWIRFNRSTLTKLQAYRSRQGHADWDATFDALLAKADS
jgi:hypothetical protein